MKWFLDIRKVFVVTFVIIGVLFATTMMFFRSIYLAEREGFGFYQDQAGKAEDMVTNFFFENVTILNSLANTIHFQKNHSVFQIERFIQNLQLEEGRKRLRFYFPDGTVMTEKGEYALPTGEAGYTEMLSNFPKDDFYISPMQKDWLDTSTEMLEIRIPFRKSGKVIGILAADFTKEELLSQFKLEAYEGEAEVSIIDLRTNAYLSMKDAEISSLDGFRSLMAVDDTNVQQFVDRVRQREITNVAVGSEMLGEVECYFACPSVIPYFTVVMHAPKSLVFNGAISVRNKYSALMGAELLLFVFFLCRVFQKMRLESRRKVEQAKQAAEAELKNTQQMVSAFSFFMENLLAVFYINPYTGEMRYYDVKQDTSISDIQNQAYQSGNLYGSFQALLTKEKVLEEDLEECRKNYSRENIIRIYEKGTDTPTEIRWLAPDGSIIWIRNKFFRMDGKDGEPRLLLAVENATEEKAKLAQQINRARGLAGSFLKKYSRVYLVDLDKDICKVIREEESLDFEQGETKSFTDLMHIRLHQMVLQDDWELMEREISMQRIRERLQKEDSYVVTYRDVTGERVRWHELRVAMLGTSSEVLLGFTDRHEDIIADKIYKKMQENCIALYYIDLKEGAVWTIVKPRTAYENITEYGKACHYSDAVIDLMSHIPKESQQVWKGLIDVKNLQKLLLQDGKYEFEFMSINNIWRRATFYVLEWQKNQPMGAVMSFVALDKESVERIQLNQEVARQKNMLEMQQAELREAREQAVAANEAKTAFLFNMSHDIRTPMNAIIGYTAMARKYIDDKLHSLECLTKIDVSGQQLLSLVNQVLEMSRIESGKAELIERHADVFERANAMITIIGADARVKGIELHCNLKNIQHKDVLVDVDRVNQIVVNVLGNAVKYTMEDGRISFTVEEKESSRQGYGLYVFTIEDTGIGMSEEYQKHIYDAFSREKTSTVSGIQGTGLGMLIVKRLVDLLGGTIDIVSKQGIGTTVKFSIPMCWMETEAAAEEEEKELVAENLEGRRILPI